MATSAHQTWLMANSPGARQRGLGSFGVADPALLGRGCGGEPPATTAGAVVAFAKKPEVSCCQGFERSDGRPPMTGCSGQRSALMIL
jgi:hypothetical protein